MSVSKPNIALARFGVDGSNADASNSIAPSSGQRDVGWELNQIPPSSVATYLEIQKYRWFQFLDEVFKVAGTAIADLKISGTGTVGTLVVTSGGAAIVGDSTVSGDLHATEDLVADGGLNIGGNANITGLFSVTGKTTLNGSLSATKAVSIEGTISPTTITSTSTIDDYNPTGLATAAVIRQAVNTGGTTVLVTGLTAPLSSSTGQLVVLHVLSTLAGDTLTLKHDDAGSSPNNRFLLATGTNLVVPAFGTVVLLYDFVSSRWRSVAKSF